MRVFTLLVLAALVRLDSAPSARPSPLAPATSQPPTAQAGRPPVTASQPAPRSFQGGRQVELTVGQVAENLSIALPRGAVIAGRIVNDVGEPVADFRASAFRVRYRAGRREVGAVGRYGRTNDLGEFRISRLPPGTYFVGTAGGLQASSATGQIAFEGDSQPPLTPAIRIFAAEPAGSRGMSSLGTSVIAEDWSFEIAGISPGKRVFRMTGLPATHALKSVFIDGEDVIDTETEFDGKGEIHDIRLVVSSRVTAVTGLATDDRGRPTEEYALVVFSSNPERWGRGTRYVATARPDQNGRFTVTGLPPGEYLVAALNYVERGESTSPEFLASILSDATSVRLAEGETRTVSLKVIVPER